jgi:dihydropyrimidinase
LGRDDFTKIPNGCGGVEERLHVLWHLGVNNGRLTPEKFVALTATNAAKAFNLWPRKGSLAVGADADLIALDPDKSKPLSAATQHQNTDFSVWEGMQVKGVVVLTFAGGRHVWADGDLRAEPGRGAICRASRSGWPMTACCDRPFIRNPCHQFRSLPGLTRQSIVLRTSSRSLQHFR